MTQALSAPYSQRRAALAARIGKHGVAVLPTAPEQQRNRDSDFLFRFDSYFHYLSGFTEPRAWLVITGDGKTTLFCQPKDLEREIWDGIRLGPDAAPEALGIDAAYSVDELDQRMPALLDGADAVWYPFATHKGSGNTGRRLAQRAARPRALRRAHARTGTRPVRPARRNAPDQRCV
jgi:Xaa-Pro aminopeptidase